MILYLDWILHFSVCLFIILNAFMLHEYGMKRTATTPSFISFHIRYVVNTVVSYDSFFLLSDPLYKHTNKKIPCNKIIARNKMKW